MKQTVLTIQARKGSSSKIVMVTAYDATFAGLLENAGADVLLVGDSVGMVVQGHENTIPVTLDDMVYHTRAVARGSHHALVVADLPFMTYKESSVQAMQSATRLMQDGRAHAVKLEGGQEIADSVHAIVAAGIPVMGHIGLTPQSVHALGGFKVQGRKQEAAALLREDAIALEEAGCFALVLEGIPASLAAQITRSINIPTIGIGAGPHCDGQVLVCYDLLGLNPHFKPKFLKQYAQLHENVSDAVKNYCEEVRAGIFPASEHSFDEPWAAINDDDLPEGIRYAGSH